MLLSHACHRDHDSLAGAFLPRSRHQSQRGRADAGAACARRPRKQQSLLKQSSPRPALQAATAVFTMHAASLMRGAARRCRRLRCRAHWPSNSSAAQSAGHPDPGRCQIVSPDGHEAKQASIRTAITCGKATFRSCFASCDSARAEQLASRPAGQRRWPHRCGAEPYRPARLDDCGGREARRPRAGMLHPLTPVVPRHGFPRAQHACSQRCRSLHDPCQVGC